MRIAVMGPQNTGKTTFIKDFLKNFPGYYSPKETYRDVVHQNKLKVNRQTTERSQRLIRDFLYQQVLKNKDKNVVFDRCVLDNLIYSKYQYEQGKFSKSYIDKTKEMVLKSLDHLDVLVFIPTGISIHLINDQLRDINTRFIDDINRMFIEELLEVAKRKDIKIHVISGTRQTRIKNIKKFLGVKMLRY